MLGIGNMLYYISIKYITNEVKTLRGLGQNYYSDNLIITP